MSLYNRFTFLLPALDVSYYVQVGQADFRHRDFFMTCEGIGEA